MLRIFCKNSGTSQSFPEGTTLLEMLPAFEFERPYPIVSAKVNNVSQGLKFKVYNNKDIEFLDVRDASGMRVYCRSLFFLLCKAARDVFPDGRIYLEHPISNGYFCNFNKVDGSATTTEDVARIRGRMREIVDEDLPFHRYEVHTDEAVRIFKERGYADKVKLFETSGTVYTDYYTLGDTPDYYYGRLVPSAGYVKVWGLEPYHGGMLLRVPDRHNPTALRPFVEQP